MINFLPDSTLKTVVTVY